MECIAEQREEQQRQIMLSMINQQSQSGSTAECLMTMDAHAIRDLLGEENDVPATREQCTTRE